MRAETLAAERNLTFVHPYDDRGDRRPGHHRAGDAEDAPDLDTLVVPIGGGGLIAGIAIAASASAGDRDGRGGGGALSVDLERAERRDRPCGGSTLAEGIAVKNVGALTLPIVRALVDESCSSTSRISSARSRPT